MQIDNLPSFRQFICAAAICSLLISCSTTAKEPDETQTPLHDAAFGAHFDDEDKALALSLIKKGKDVNMRDEYGNTPLHHCRIDVTVPQALIAKGANVNARNNWGRTPIFSAIERTEGELTDVLLQNGAEVDVRDCFGVTPREMAEKYETSDMLGGVRKNVGYSALHAAAEKGNLATVKQLLAAGASVSGVDSHGETPLHKAANAGALQVAELLIQKGASVRAKDVDGRTPLHLAAKKSAAVSQLLVKKGADVGATDVFGMTPLHIAAANDCVESARYLLSCGARVNALSKTGFTPLHAAATSTHYAVIPLLLQAGADKKIRDMHGRYAYELIPGRGDDQFEWRALLGESPEI